MSGITSNRNPSRDYTPSASRQKDSNLEQLGEKLARSETPLKDKKTRMETLRKHFLVQLFIFSSTILACILAACAWADISKAELFKYWETWLVIICVTALIALGWKEGKNFSRIIRFITIIGLSIGIVHFLASTYCSNWSFTNVFNGRTNRALDKADKLLFDLSQFIELDDDKLPLGHNYTRDSAADFILSATSIESLSTDKKKNLAAQIKAAKKTLVDWEERIKPTPTPAPQLSRISKRPRVVQLNWGDNEFFLGDSGSTQWMNGGSGDIFFTSLEKKDFKLELQNSTVYDRKKANDPNLYVPCPFRVVADETQTIIVTRK